MRLFGMKNLLVKINSALRNTRQIWSIKASQVIDVGAAQGKWSTMCYIIRQTASYVLIEPLEENLAPFHKMLASKDNWRQVAAAAGAESNEVINAVTEDQDGSAVSDGTTPLQQGAVPVVSLDEICPRKTPFLLKPDLHGCEIPTVGAASRLLNRTMMIIVAAYGHRISSQAAYC